MNDIIINTKKPTKQDLIILQGHVDLLEQRIKKLQIKHVFRPTTEIDYSILNELQTLTKEFKLLEGKLLDVKIRLKGK